ncbi:MAG: PHB depolymerase family esterase [Candidatus Limnocylindrales bacterium]|nr:PHB depolymerase family esterase [Candidatus Limnocylindrales bacterium]
MDRLTPARPVALRHNDRWREYLLHVPPVLDARPRPLVIALHGGGSTPASVDRLTGMYALADREGFVLAVPRGIGGHWDDGRPDAPFRVRIGDVDDVGFLDALIDHVAGGGPINQGRVYVTGMSNGASMAGRLAVERAHRIAAIGQVAGTASPDVVAHGHPACPVPVLQIHGTADPLVPYEGGTVRGPLGRRRGVVLGVEAWLAFWVARNGATADPVVSSLGTDTTIRSWHGTSSGSDVIAYRIGAGGHTWPGGPQYLPSPLIGKTTRTFSASEVIWRFFADHQRG